MRRLAFWTLAAFLACGAASAQTPVPSPTPPTTYIAFEHDGVNTDGYRLRVDDVTTLVTPTCTGVAAERLCTIPFPALTPGNHTLWVIAFNAAGEASSDPFPVTVFVQPAKPANIRIIIK